MTIAAATDFGAGDVKSAPPDEGSIQIHVLSTVPSAPRVGNSAAYIQDPTGAVTPLVNGVSTFNGRSGAVSPIQADYDTFFLTPAEGAAAYDAIGSAAAAAAASVPTSRTLTTTAPLTIDGAASANLSANRTLAIVAATTSVPGSMSAADKSRNDNWFNKAFYNVLDNGISTANSAATNLTAWDALAAAAVDNATIFFPPSASTYDFSNVCAIPSGKHFRIMGGGPQKSIVRTTNATANIFSCADWYQEFHGLKFASSVTRTAGAAILSGNNVAVSVFDCHFHEMWDGIRYSGGANAGNLAIVRNCGFTETKARSIIIDGTDANSIITECVGDGTAGLADAHVEVNACGSILMSDCDWIRAVNNLLLNPDSGTKGVFSIYCTNVFFDTASGSSVKFQGGAAGTNIQRVKFANCWFSGSVTGCEFAAVTSTNKPTAIDFTNCDIYSNSAFGVLATEVQDFAMSNCRVAGNATAGVRTNAAAGSVTKFNLQNNTFGPTAGIGANGIGVDVVAGTYGSYVITGNNVAGNTSDNNIIDAGSVATTDLSQVGNNAGHLLLGGIDALNSAVATSGITETLLKSWRIPAKSVKVGTTFRIRMAGLSSSTGTLIFRVRVDTVGTGVTGNQAYISTTSAAQVANAHATTDLLLTVRSIGAGGTVICDGVSTAGAVVLPTLIGAAATAAANTDNAWFIKLDATCSVGTFTAQVAILEAY